MCTCMSTGSVAVATLSDCLSRRRATHPPTHPTCQTWRLGPKKILDSVECYLGMFHLLCEGAEQGTDIADIGVFHLVTNQEGNLHCVHMYVYQLRRGRDVLQLLVA